MSAEKVPRHGKADVAFAGAELRDAWLLILSIFVGLVVGAIFGWVAYIGIPVAGYFATKAYIEWKKNNLPGYLTLLMYRLGLTGYSNAFNRKKKLFIGDSKIINPSAARLGAIVRADAQSAQVADMREPGPQLDDGADERAPAALAAVEELN